MTILLATLSPAWGHAALTRSVPGNRDVLAHSPSHIRLRFNEKVEARFSTISLEDAQGHKTALGAVTSSAGDSHGLEAAVPVPLPPGRYTVHYRVLSQDGHVIERSFGFTLEAADGVAAPAP